MPPPPLADVARLAVDPRLADVSPFIARPVIEAASSGWVGFILLLLIAPGLLVLIAVVIAFLFRRRAREGRGYYHLLGFDKSTQARREMTVPADSRQSAVGRADLDGMVVTEVSRVDKAD